MTTAQRLDAVCELTMGQAPDGESYNTDGEGLPLIAGAGDFGEKSPVTKKFTRAPGKICREGDIVLGIRATIGEKVVADRDYCLGRGVAALRTKDGLSSRYLWHWLTHITPSLSAKARGATFKQVNRKDISELVIELPDLPTQQRIAEVLDRADALRAMRLTARAKLNDLTASLFYDAFGDTVRNSKGWSCSATLGDIADIASGITKGRKLSGQKTRTVPYLAVSNVQDRALKLEIVKQIEATEDEIGKYRLRRGDLLLTEGGDPDKLGRGTLWDDQIPECIHQNHIFRVRVNSPEIEPLFLNWLIGSERGKRYFLRSAKQTTGIASINMTQLRGFPLLIPPIELQRQFVRQVAIIEHARALQRVSLEGIDALSAVLQSRAFGGGL